MNGLKTHLTRWSYPGSLCLAGALTLLAAIGQTVRISSHGEVDSLVAKCRIPKDSGSPKADKSGNSPPAPSAAVARVSTRNVFTPRQEKAQFQAKLIGVLGNEAMFDGKQSVALGGTINGARLTAIGPDWAEVEFEGRKIKLNVFNSSGESGSPRRPGGPGGPGGPQFGPSGPVRIMPGRGGEMPPGTTIRSMRPTKMPSKTRGE